MADIRHITTETGFECDIDLTVVDDYRFVKGLVKINKKNDSAAVFDIIDLMLTEDQQDELMQHVADENGRVPLAKIGYEIGSIMKACDELKNLQSSPT